MVAGRARHLGDYGTKHALCQTMANKKYSIFFLPLFSFFSKRLYRDIGWNWKGANLAYLFILLAICWIPSTLSLRNQMLTSLGASELNLLNQVPDLHIENGRTIYPQTKPYFITRANGTPLAIIDTTGSMNFIDDDNVMALLTETELIVRLGPNQFNTLDLSQVSSLHINKQILRSWLWTAKKTLAPLSYGIFLLISYLFTLLFLLLISLIGLLISTAAHASLKFPGVLRIAAAAATPSIILITLTVAVDNATPLAVYTAPVLTVSYLLIGILSCKKHNAEKETPRLKLAALLASESDMARTHTHAA